MIVLGQSGNPDALKLFLDEIRNPKQTVWVKLWALRGISNIKERALSRLSATQEIDAARIIALQLEKSVDQQEWPWTVQYRALEALAQLRQGFDPRSPQSATWRSPRCGSLPTRSPARSCGPRRLGLGMMQITSAVSKLQFLLVPPRLPACSGVGGRDHRLLR